MNEEERLKEKLKEKIEESIETVYEEYGDVSREENIIKNDTEGTEEEIKTSGIGVLAGILAGGGIGLIGGPVGIIIGAMMGAVVGDQIEYYQLKRRRKNE